MENSQDQEAAHLALQDQQADQLSLIVDGDYLYRAFKDVLGRPPNSGDRTDFEELKRYAASMRPGGYFVAAHYFQRRQPSDAFYNALQRFGYELFLTDYDEFESWRIVKGNILSDLQALRATNNDVLYVGGDSYSGEITVALLNLRLRPNGTRRKVYVAHFERRTDFIGEELDMLDLVTDVEAVPPHVYHESDQRTRYPEGYLQAAQQPSIPSPLPPPPPPPPPSLPPESPFGQQLRQAIDDSPSFTVPPAEEAPPREVAPPPPIQLPTGPRNIVVLIDHENIDWSLGNLIGADQLNIETRPRWSELRRFVEQRAAGGDVQLLSFLQHNDAITGFAVYLDGEAGFHPILLESEVDQTGRRRPVVDEAIHRSLHALRERECDVLIVSNDGGYLRHMQALRDHGQFRRSFGVIGFVDEMSALYRNENWVDTFDLERDVGAFSYALPRRYMPIALDQFDVSAVLGDFGLPAADSAGAAPVAEDEPPYDDVEEVEPTGFKVILQSHGDDDTAVITTVRAATGLPLLEAKRLVNRAPVTIRDGLTEAEADALEDALLDAGAEVEVIEIE